MHKLKTLYPSIELILKPVCNTVYRLQIIASVFNEHKQTSPLYESVLKFHLSFNVASIKGYNQTKQ